MIQLIDWFKNASIPDFILGIIIAAVLIRLLWEIIND